MERPLASLKLMDLFVMKVLLEDKRKKERRPAGLIISTKAMSVKVRSQEVDYTRAFCEKVFLLLSIAFCSVIEDAGCCV